MPRSSEHPQEQQLLQQLRTRGDAVSLQDAAQLEKAYHDREMAYINVTCDVSIKTEETILQESAHSEFIRLDDLKYFSALQRLNIKD